MYCMVHKNTYSFNWVSLEEHPRAYSADLFSENDFVVLYKCNNRVKVSGSVLYFNPVQNAASLMSAGILNGADRPSCTMYIMHSNGHCMQNLSKNTDFSPEYHFLKYSSAFFVQSLLS